MATIPQQLRPPLKSSYAFTACDFKPLAKNTLIGFVTIQLPSGMRIKECTVHEKNEKRWVSLPGKPWTKADGTVSYTSILDFVSEDRKRQWQQLALAAVNELLQVAV